MAGQAFIFGNDSQLAVLRQAGMLVGIAASVALGLYVVLWSRTPNYSMIFSDLSDKDVSQVIATLAAVDIPYRLDHDSGTVMVPSSTVDDARLKLAAAGVPKGKGLGFELLDEEQGFGTSQFIERARYQRAIEGELSRSIARINNVRGARVHLALPQEMVFARSKRTPSASVIIDLYPGRRLEPHQVGAITHLVSASVPNLAVDKVTVVDQQGNLLTEQDVDSDMAVTMRRFDHTRRVEQSYVDRIEAILTPVVGIDGVRAQVTADIDYTATEQTRESFNPDLPAVRSEQTLEEARGALDAGGVPGALSNQPPAEATAPEDVAVAANPTVLPGAEPVPAPPQNRRTQTMKNYELDRTISHTKPSLGVMRRLSVAVVVRNPAAAEAEDEEGDTAAQGAPAYSAEQLELMTNLVKEAIGFEETRGDTVRITGVDFLEPPAPEPLPEPPMWKQPWVWDVAKQALGGIFVLFVLFGVLRPTMKSLMAKSGRAQHLTVAGDGDTRALPPGAGGAAGAGGTLPVVAGQAPRIGSSQTFDGNIEQIKSFVNQDPKVAAQVIRGWVGEGR